MKKFQEWLEENNLNESVKSKTATAPKKTAPANKTKSKIKGNSSDGKNFNKGDSKGCSCDCFPCKVIKSCDKCSCKDCDCEGCNCKKKNK